ncbi:hypothetical protein ACIGMX_34380 [Streptomyces aquilus]|uniref:hypothetical protein n=1 Tax=Streptomyces aquilus TaxID=2548456 RepID=UPI0037D7D021
MFPNSCGLGSARSAAVVNEEIRALLLRTGGWLSAEDRGVYEQLVEEWTQAVATERVEVVEAA